MKKQQVIIALFFLYFYQLQCMTNTDLTINVKLNNKKTYEINFNTAIASNTIHEKYLWKKKLAIDLVKPIIVPDISYKKLCLFTQAVCATEKNFKSFFQRLTNKQQKTLMSISGKDKLNSPYVTALITCAYVPSDVIQECIIPYLGKEKIKHYMRYAMIKTNMHDPEFNPLQVISYQIISHANGIFHLIPTNFTPSNTLCTTNCSVHDYNDQKQQTLAYIHKITDQCIYDVFSNMDENGNRINYLGCIQKNENKIKQLDLFPDTILNVICSPDGRYMVMRLDKKVKNLIFYCLDPSTDTLITKKIILPKVLKYLTKIHFDHTSTKLFVFSFNDEGSRMFIYNIAQEKKRLMEFATLLPLVTFNHDSTRMIVWEVLDNHPRFNVQNISDISQLSSIKTISLNKDCFVTALQYSHNTNIAAARLHNGNILLIRESPIGTISLSHMINPHTSESPYRGLSLLFSLDNKILIDHSKTTEEQLNRITAWDIQSGQCIAQDQRHLVDEFLIPEIIMSSDNNSFIINIKESFLWLQYFLYNSTEQNTLQYINDNKNLFTLYILRRMYLAHKQNEEIIIPTNDLEKIIQSMPNASFDIQECIKKYLLLEYKKSLFENVQTYSEICAHECEKAFDSFISFFKNLINKKI